MKNNKITFKFSNEKFIEILLPCSKYKLNMCDEIEIIFYNTNEQYVLYNDDCAIYGVRQLNDSLKSALSSNLELDKSIKKDIGFLWNEDMKGKKTDLDFINYLIWESLSPNKLDTWMYTKNKEMFLEITPIYKWHYTDLRTVRRKKEFISYEEFIKNYKPLDIIKLDKETAEQWLQQTEELMNIMNANYEKYEKENNSKVLDD